MMRKIAIFGVLLALFLSVAPSLSQESTTLTVMHWEAAQVEGTPWWDEIVNGFLDTHPGVTIENNFVTFNQYLTTLAAMTAGDSLPDVFFGHVKAAELGRAGLALDYRDVVDQDFLDQFYPGPMRQFTFDDGAVYALPYTAQIFGIFVNDRIMTELGLTVPNTWDELIEMVPTIREAGLTPLLWGNGARNVCPDFFLPLVTQYGGDVYALDDLTAEGVTWDSEPVVNALTLLQRLAQAGVFIEGINGIDMALTEQLAYQGAGPMLYSGSWQPSNFDAVASQDWLDNYSVHKVPALTADDIHWTGDGSGVGWVINAQSPNKDLAVEFVKYMFEPDVYALKIGGQGEFPSMPSAAELVTNPKVQEMLSWLSTDGSDHILFGTGSWDAVSNVCSAILDGSIEPAAGAAQIQADIMATRAQAVSS
jgi:ABC-type glycerol-3-phosphate transport system substrate-binding protein